MSISSSFETAANVMSPCRRDASVNGRSNYYRYSSVNFVVVPRHLTVTWNLLDKSQHSEYRHISMISANKSVYVVCITQNVNLGRGCRTKVDVSIAPNPCWEKSKYGRWDDPVSGYEHTLFLIPLSRWSVRILFPFENPKKRFVSQGTTFHRRMPTPLEGRLSHPKTIRLRIFIPVSGKRPSTDIASLVIYTHLSRSVAPYKSRVKTARTKVFLFFFFWQKHIWIISRHA